MGIRRRSILVLVTGLACLMLAGVVVVAQVGGTSDCPDIVSQALQAVNNLCTGQSRNSACYGNTLVDAQFTSEQPTGFFTSEGDIADLGLFKSIETSPLNDALTEWGVSILSVQANLPGALPGQNALFMLVGGAQIESAVQPENAFVPATPIPVTAAADAVVLDAADAGAATVLTVTAGQTLLADAQSDGGLFFRVTVGDQFGWIDAAALTPDPALASLPVYQPGSSFTPMQAFYLRTGIGSPQCAVAPSALVVQGPQNYTVNINANGANVALGSSVIFETVPLDEAKATGKYQGQPGVGGLLRITVIDGHATIFNEDGTVTEVPEGYQSTICLTEPEDLGVDGQPNDQSVTYVCGGWTAPEEIPPEFRERFGLVDDFPLNYMLDILTPTPQPVAPAVSTPTFTPTPAPTETPWPVIPTDTPVPQMGLQLVADVQLAPSMGGAAAGLPRFLGAGEGGYNWFFNLLLTVTNSGDNPATNIVIGNVFPEGMGDPYVEADSGEYDYQANTWTIPELAPGQSSFLGGGSMVFLDCGGSISSQLTISADTVDPFPPVFSYSTIADCRAGITLGINASLMPDQGAAASSVFAGAGSSAQPWILDLNIVVANFGPLTATDLSLSNIFPSGISGLATTEGGTFDSQTNTWTIGEFAPGASAFLSGSGSVFLSCGGSVESIVTVNSTTPVYQDLWPYTAIAECAIGTPMVEPPAANMFEATDAPELTETPAPEVTEAPVPETTQSPEPPPETTPESTAPPA